MRYKISPFNISAALFICYAMFLYTKPGTDGFDALGGIACIIFAVLTVGADLLVHSFSEGYRKIWTIELAIIGFLWICLRLLF